MSDQEIVLVVGLFVGIFIAIGIEYVIDCRHNGIRQTGNWEDDNPS